MKPIEDCQLYCFVDTAYLHGRPVEVLAEQLCEGGADLIQLRAKTSSVEEIRRMAEKVLAVTEPAGVGLVINDYPKIAREVGAQVCHLGQEDFTGYSRAVEVTGGPGGFKLGLSTHGPEQARAAIAAEPDYIAVGPVYATGTKPGAAPVTLGYVRWAAAEVSIPWFAIGGISLETLEAVLEAGARRIAVVSAILNASDVTEACQEFKKRITSARLR